MIMYNPGIPAHSPASLLPPEIMDMILCNVVDSSHSKLTLASCVRLNRAWNHSSATALLYHTIQPETTRALRLLELKVRRCPQIGNYIKKLVFPEFGPYAMDMLGNRLPFVSSWHQSRADDATILRQENKFKVKDFDARKEDMPEVGLKFTAILRHCHQLQELHAPTYWFGLNVLHFLSPGAKNSLKSLVLLGKFVMHYDVSAAYGRELQHSASNLGDIVLPQVDTLTLADCVLHEGKGMEAFLHYLKVAKLKNLHFFGGCSQINLAWFFSEVSHTLTSVSIIGVRGILMWAFIAQNLCFPTMRTLTSHCAATQLNYRFPSLEGLKSVTFLLLPGENCLDVSTVPQSVEEVTIVHPVPVMQDVRVIQPLALACIIRQIFAYMLVVSETPKTPALKKFTLKAVSTKLDLEKWKVVAFMLHDLFRRCKITFQLDIRILSDYEPYQFLLAVLEMPGCMLQLK